MNGNKSNSKSKSENKSLKAKPQNTTRLRSQRGSTKKKKLFKAKPPNTKSFMSRRQTLAKKKRLKLNTGYKIEKWLKLGILSSGAANGHEMMNELCTILNEDRRDDPMLSMMTDEDIQKLKTICKNRKKPSLTPAPIKGDEKKK